MPLPKRAVIPTNVSQVSVPADTPSELQYVFDATLANLIRQLSSLSRQASDLFNDLSAEIAIVTQRSTKLCHRIDRLNEKMATLYMSEEDLSAGLKELRLEGYHSHLSQDQQVVNRFTIPNAVSEMYMCCERPPPLDALDCYRDDSKSSMKFYTDPSFFFELWCQEMLQEPKKKQSKKKRPKASKKKKIRPVELKTYDHLAKGEEFKEAFHPTPTSVPFNQPRVQPSVAQSAVSQYNGGSVSIVSVVQGPKPGENGGLPPAVVSADNYLSLGQHTPTQSVSYGDGGMENGAAITPVLPPPPLPHSGYSMTIRGPGPTLLAPLQYNFDESSHYAQSSSYHFPLPSSSPITPPGTALTPSPGVQDLPPPPASLESTPGSGPNSPPCVLPPTPLPPPPPPPPPPPANATDRPYNDLLTAIREGMELRRVEERREREKPPPAMQQLNVQAIFEAVSKRRHFLENNSDSEEEEEEADDGWSSDDNN